MNAHSKVRFRTTTITSREFNQELGKAKQASKDGPVIVTDRGRPAHVLMSYENYARLTNPPRSVLESLADTRPEADFAYEFERARGQAREVDFGLGDD